MSGAPDGDPAPVVAAGGVVVRPDGRVAVVHRPRYDDWSLPKGKADPGEVAEATALREVAEETGLVCRLVTELETIRYRDRHGRDKVVRYWLMAPDGDGSDPLVPNDEVDELRWCDHLDAADLLTYAADRALVASVLSEPPGEGATRSGAT